jgi:hypothetical protein
MLAMDYLLSFLQNVTGCKFWNNSALLGGSDIYLSNGTKYDKNLTTNSCSESRGITLLVNITILSHLLPSCEIRTAVFVAVDGFFLILDWALQVIVFFFFVS